MNGTFILVLLATANSCVFANVLLRVQSFVDHEIVPDVLNSPPANILWVKFPNGIEALEGNELSPNQVAGVPSLVWDANPDRFYTLVFCDAPSRVNPEARSYLHWLVVNIPGEDVTAGQTIVSILNSHPEPETGLHRYIFLIYEQPEEMIFEGLPEDTFDGRVGFSPEEFSSRHSLGTAIAGNFYQTENLEE